MKLKTAWKARDGSGFRVSAPPDSDTESWEEVEIEKLNAADRASLGIEKISEEFLGRMKALEKEVDHLKLQQLARGTAAGEGQGKVQPVSLLKVFRGMYSGDWRGADYEKSVIDSDKARQMRALAAGTDAAGGAFVPSEYLEAEFIPLLRANTILDKLPIRRLTGLVGSPVQIPKQTGGATAYWIGENAVINDSTQATGQLVLRPRCLAAMTKVSKQLVMQANPSAENFVQQDLAAVMGVELTRAALVGDGGSGEPVGVINTAGITATAVTAAADHDDVFDMQVKIETGNVDTDTGMGLVCHPQEWNTIRKAADGAGTPKVYAGAGFTIVDAVCGFPVVKTTKLTAGQAVLGKWSEFIVGEWGGVMFEASDQAGDAFAYHQVWIKATQFVDFGIRQPAAFCYNPAFNT